MAATYAAPALPGFRAVRPAHRPITAVPRPRAAARRGQAASPALRITRRGRLVVLAVALLVVLLPGAWRAMATAQVEGPAHESVMVQPGDTLWGIAAAIDPGADPRSLIAEIREVNGLTQYGLKPNKVLLFPTG